MSNHWLYCQPLPAAPAEYTLEGPEAHHARVKHLEPGEAVHLFDGRGHVAAARVVTLGKLTVSLRIETVATVAPRTPRLIVAVSRPKGERLDWMLEKLTELGVAAIWPLECERSVAGARQDRMDRWQRRIIEAAKQAHVAWLPTIQPVKNLPQLLERAAEFTDLLVADTAGPARPILAARLAAGARPLILIGPEGGFSDAERERMRRSGFHAVSLGTTVLRTETAAVVAAACLLTAADLADWSPATDGSAP
jgi:16S rRNA (uracil1498-N3)-methyltransferase